MGEVPPREIDRYRVVTKLGEGGMGIVYRATDPRLMRTIALKVLSDASVQDPLRRRRFLREARLSAAMTHPNIASVYDVGETDAGEVFIAMELVSGDSLRKRLLHTAETPAVAVRIAKELCAALSHAHARGIIHRDLKPDNVMVNADLHVKVLDFGLAKAIDDDVLREPAQSVVTADGHVLGTPGYMSPEQAAGRETDLRTDIFALGVVLFEMLTGRRPFAGSTAVEVIISAARDEPERPSRLSDVHPALERIVLRCIEKLPDARFADADEVLTALSALPPEALTTSSAAPRVIRADAMTTAPSLIASTSPPRTIQPTRRPSRKVLAAAGALILCGALASWVAVRRQPESAAPQRASASAPSQMMAPPPFADPELRAEYVAGMQALRDDDWGIAQLHFSRIVAKDPLLALGHLRLAMAAEGTLDDGLRREHFAQAVTLRAQLSDRDSGLLDALEPILQRHNEDRAEAAARLHALAARLPPDAEIEMWLAMIERTLPPAERAITLDPLNGQAWQTHGDVLAMLGRADESRASYERCGSVSAGSAECFLGLVWLESTEGRCEAAVSDARRAVDRDPHLAGTLACVMLGAGRPVEAVREVLDQSAATFAVSPRPSIQHMLDETRLLIAKGDFERARTAGEAYLAATEVNPHTAFRDHLFAATLLVGIAGEVGDDELAKKRAWAFTSRSETWTKAAGMDAGIDGSLVLARRSMGRTGFVAADLDARRATWIEQQRRSLAYGGHIWTYAYAATAETEDEAKAALAVLPSFAPLASFVYYAGIPDAEIGHAYLLAGSLDLALPRLTRAARSCGAFRHPFVYTRALLELGLLQERRGSVALACDAYRSVQKRWGDAKPRSTSAEAAVARMKALRCGD